MDLATTEDFHPNCIWEQSYTKYSTLFKEWKDFEQELIR